MTANIFRSRLVGIAGFARAGKDTIAGQLCDWHIRFGVHTKCYAFACELKREVDPFSLEKFGISAWTTNETEKELIRPMLIAVGQARIKQDPLYYVHQVAAKIEHDQPDVAIITDVRFKPEAQWLKENDGTLVRVVRRGVLAAHESEEKGARDLDPFVNYEIKFNKDAI